LTPARALCAQDTWDRKESALKKTLRMAQSALFALAPALLAFSFVVQMGKRW